MPRSTQASGVGILTLHACTHKLREQREATSCLWVGEDEPTVQLNKL